MICIVIVQSVTCSKGAHIIIARRAYCVETSKNRCAWRVCNVNVTMYDDVCVSIALALGLDIWPCFAAWTSRLRFWEMSPCLSFGPKMWRFTFDKPVLVDQKKVQKSDKNEIFSISDPKMCRFRNSKPVLGDSKLNRHFGPPALRV